MLFEQHGSLSVQNSSFLTKFLQYPEKKHAFVLPSLLLIFVPCASKPDQKLSTEAIVWAVVLMKW